MEDFDSKRGGAIEERVLFVDGNYQPVIADGAIEVISPYSRECVYRQAECGSKEVAGAVASARNALENWQKLGPAARRDILIALAEGIQANAGELAEFDSEDMGKPIATAGQDPHIASGFIRYYAEMIDKIHQGQIAPSGDSVVEFQIMKPRGVVATITPWNFPVINVGMKIGPALAAGNCVIVKPSELSPRSALRIAAIAIEAGLPPGVLNVVPGGSSTGDALVRHPGVDMVAFTGSTSTGKKLMSAVGDSTLKPLLLECGGKSPEIVFDEFQAEELGQIAEQVVRGALFNQGQVCVARTRILIEHSVYETFVEKMSQVAESIQPHDPRDASCIFGPLASARQRRMVEGYIEGALETGATLALDGRLEQPNDGALLGPTIICDAPRDSAISTEEVFGPVLTLFSFSDEDDAISLANATSYGLAATIWTRNVVRAHRVSNALDIGKVKVSTSPGSAEGAMFAHSAEPAGQSGFGVEGGQHGMLSYMRRQSIEMVMP